jgi:hypothetical protein
LGAAAAGAVWVAPAVLSLDVAGAGGSADPCAALLDWDAFVVGSIFSGTTVNGVTVTATSTPISGGVPTGANLSIVAGPSGGIAGNALFVEQVPGADGAGQDVRFTFSASVQNVTFTVTDIDNLAGAWSDRIRIPNRGTLGFSYTIPPGGLVTGVGRAADPIRNSDANLNLANTDPRGNAIMTFAGPLTTFRIRYLNGPITGGSNQLIRITDMEFRTC